MLLLTIVASGIHFVETNLQVLFIGEPEDCCKTWVRCKNPMSDKDSNTTGITIYFLLCGDFLVNIRKTVNKSYRIQVFGEGCV